MTTETQDIFRAAMALPEAERILLADELLEAEFAVELDRRAAECRRDPSITIPLSGLVQEG
jgi:hypothetical protein